jgi:hypothetical protein
MEVAYHHASSADMAMAGLNSGAPKSKHNVPKGGGVRMTDRSEGDG